MIQVKEKKLLLKYMYECVCEPILNKNVCKSTYRYDCNGDWLDVNVILVSLFEAKNVRLQMGGGRSNVRKA